MQIGVLLLFCLPIAKLHAQQSSPSAYENPCTKPGAVLADYSAVPDGIDAVRAQHNEKPYRERIEPADSQVGIAIFIDRVRRPDLPLDWSDTIVLGTVTTTKSFVTADRSNVFTEYDISVSEVFESAAAANVSTGQAITVEREGGCVKFPSAEIQRLWLPDEGTLDNNSTYVLFLRYEPDGGKDFRVVTAYAIDSGIVHAVDNESNFRTYDNATENRLLSDVRAAVRAHLSIRSRQQGTGLIVDSTL